MSFFYLRQFISQVFSYIFYLKTEKKLCGRPLPPFGDFLQIRSNETKHKMIFIMVDFRSWDFIVIIRGQYDMNLALSRGGATTI